MIVTRGDRDIREVCDTVVTRPLIVWDNTRAATDMGAFGRYLALALTDADAVYVQDDDCVVPPEAQRQLLEEHQPETLTVNMPASHNAGHPRLALPGWGSVFAPALPRAAFARWAASGGDITAAAFLVVGCDIVFPVLTASRRLDLGHQDLPCAHTQGRTHLQPGYTALKQWFYDRACTVADGA